MIVNPVTNKLWKKAATAVVISCDKRHFYLAFRSFAAFLQGWNECCLLGIGFLQALLLPMGLSQSSLQLGSNLLHLRQTITSNINSTVRPTPSGVLI